VIFRRQRLLPVIPSIILAAGFKEEWQNDQVSPEYTGTAAGISLPDLAGTKKRARADYS